MYESPINQIVNEMMESITEQREDAIITTISETVGFDIDKQELIKALNYDRKQYEKGYKDAKDDMLSVIKDIKAEIIDKSYLSYDDNPRHIIDENWVLEIIDKYTAEESNKE